MHELWICKSILEIIRHNADQKACLRVKKVVLEIGQLTAIEHRALMLSFDVITEGTIAERALLEIIEIQAQAFCNACQNNIVLTQYYDPCPICGCHELTITHGEELRVKSMEVE